MMLVYFLCAAQSKAPGRVAQTDARFPGYLGNKPPLLLDRYVAVDSELLLLMVPHEHQQYCAYVKEVLPVYTILFCSESHSFPATLHIDFIVANNVPDTLPVQFVTFLGCLPPFGADFEKKVEEVIAQGLSLSGGGVEAGIPSSRSTQPFLPYVRNDAVKRRNMYSLTDHIRLGRIKREVTNQVAEPMHEPKSLFNGSDYSQDDIAIHRFAKRQHFFF